MHAILDCEVGDAIDFYVKVSDSGQTDDVEYISCSAVQLPTEEVVTPGDVPVEDVRVLLGSGAGLVNNDTVTISDTWGNLASTYEAVEFEFIGVAGTDAYRSTHRVSAANWVDNTDLVINSDATVLWQLLDMDATGSTSTINLAGTVVTSADVNVYGIKAQKTVINTTDVPVVDNSTSGYYDIGPVRFQWGSYFDGTNNNSADFAVTLPAPFADASYKVTTTLAQALPANVAVTSSVSSKTATGFTADTRRSDGANYSAAFDFIAIGPKP